ncbi:alpha-xylosidase [Arenicella xantha]|nr:alpha-xylosidase [Arenicella xantha]
MTQLPSLRFDSANTPAWNEVDAISLTAEPRLVSETRAVLESDSGDLFLELSNLGLRLCSTSQRSLDYGLIVDEPDPMALKLLNEDGLSTLSSTDFSVVIQHHPLTLSVFDASGELLLKTADDGHFVRTNRVPPLARTAEGWLISFALNSNEPMYGFGEKWSSLNKRGQLIRSFNHDALGVNAEISYKNTPFGWSPEGWGVFAHTPSAVTHAVGFAPWSQRSYCCLVEDECLDIFVLLASGEITDDDAVNKPAELIGAYTQLTGRAPMPPRWSGGVILSKAYYRDADEILAAAREVREQGMPCDVITFDGRAWQDTNTRFAFEWDAARYPDPKLVVDQLKQMNFKICVWEYPLVSVDHPWFKEFAAKGWLLRDSRTGEAYEYRWDQQAFGSVLTPLPNSGIVDFTHPDAYAFWRDAHKPLFDLGVDMIKADFGEQLEDEHMLASNGENGLALHNVYAYLYNRCVFEAAEKFSQSGAFLFSRSSWTGCQRFNSQWGGDPQADWEGMMGNLRGGLAWGLSGAPFYATDVGGFYKDTRNDALYVRWAQAGIFSAHFRLHGIGAREPWSYSDEAADAVMSVLKLRYRLQHYLRNAMQQATHSGMPVQRAMVLAFPNEKQAWAFENQFMFGDDLLVAPCFDPNGRVECYLPHGEWVRFDPESADAPEVWQGGQVHQLSLALHETAVFARRGVGIPLSAVADYTDAMPSDQSDDYAIEQIWPN